MVTSNLSKVTQLENNAARMKTSPGLQSTALGPDPPRPFQVVRERSLDGWERGREQHLAAADGRALDRCAPTTTCSAAALAHWAV